METTDTQTLENAISAPESFLPGYIPPAQQQQASSVQEAPKGENPPAQQARQEQPAQQPTAQPQANAAEAADPYEAVFSEEAPAAPIEWTEDAKKAFKSVYGHDDPLAFKAEIDTKIQEAALLKKEVESLLPLKQQIEALPPSLKRAIQLAQEGKANEAVEFIKGLPDGVILDKEAKNIPSEKLIEMYLPGKISKEDFAAVKDPDTDEEIKAVIEAKIKHYRDIAADIHERERQGVAAKLGEAEAQQKAMFEAYNGSVAKAIASVESTNLKALVNDEFKQGLKDGSLMRAFFKEDGFTYAEDAGKRLLWALHGERLADAKAKVAYSKGRSEAMLEASSRLPGAPPIKGREASGAPAKDTEQSLKEQFLPGGKMFPMGASR